MPEETITFELIRRIQREEQRIPKLTKLPENFYEKVSSYLHQKRKMEEKEDRKTALETKNIERLVEDIFNRRERKILNNALISARTNIPPENLTEEEKLFFEVVNQSLRERRRNILNTLLKSMDKQELESLIIFKEDVPEFVGSDLKSYGPFKKGEIAKLPGENMKVLIERRIAEEFKVSK
jgi:DNA replication factor GINS